MYHGAEHKSINCIENGLPLTVKNVRKQSTRHKRCGTSFMLFVIVLSAVVFMFIRVDSTVLRLVLRLLLIPVIAGVSYEFLKLAGRSENPVVNALSKPGLWLQALTTREPDDEMIKVAIKSVEAVFDWEAFLGESAVTEEAEAETKTKATESKNAKKNADKAETEQDTPKPSAPVTKAPIRRSHVPQPDLGESKPSIENSATGLYTDNDDDEILNALDRFFTYKREEAEQSTEGSKETDSNQDESSNN